MPSQFAEDSRIQSRTDLLKSIFLCSTNIRLRVLHGLLLYCSVCSVLFSYCSVCCGIDGSDYQNVLHLYIHRIELLVFVVLSRLEEWTWALKSRGFIVAEFTIRSDERMLRSKTFLC